MKFVIALLCLAAVSFGQTYRTVTAETNNVIRTNFTIPVAQVSGALATNGSAAGLTNFPASLLRTNGDGSGLTNLPNANLTNATGILPISNGGTGATNAALAISNLLPSYTGNSNRILGLNSNATSLVWTTNSGGGTAFTNSEEAMNGLFFGSSNNNGINLFLNGGTNVGDQHTVIGSGASGFGTNFGEESVVLGAVAETYNGGIAIGYSASAYEGVGIGVQSASSGRGVAIGNFATANGGDISGTGNTNYGGVAIGAYSLSDNKNGVAIGAIAEVTGGGVAIGVSTLSGWDGTIGGVAIGLDCETLSRGIAIGASSVANEGVAIGANANNSGASVTIGDSASSDPFVFANIQLGTGTNTVDESIQIFNAGSVTTNSWAALANSTALGHSTMAATIATNAPANTNAPSPDAWMLITEGTNNYYLPLWQ